MKNQTQRCIFHHSEFVSRLAEILYTLEQRSLKVTIAISTRNNESTIGKTVVLLRAEQHRYPFLQDILVGDHNSTDHTREIATAFGATVYRSDEVFSEERGPESGKGVGQWKAVTKAQGDIVVFIDGGVANIQPDMIYGVAAPLIVYDNIRYVKAFYNQDVSAERRVTVQQCLTKYVLHPLFSLFAPELLSIIQPLSGMYAAWKTDLETIPFSPSYGVEIGQLMDCYRNKGLSAIGQVELDHVKFPGHASEDPQGMTVDILSAVLSRISFHDYEERISAIKNNESPSLLALKRFQQHVRKSSETPVSEKYPDFVNQERSQDIPISPSLMERTGTYS